MKLQPWGNHQELNNGHVVGADEQVSIQWAENSSLDAYMLRFWADGGGHLFPCGCSATTGYGPPNHRIDDIEFRHEYKGAYAPTAGVPQAALGMMNRGLVDYPDPSFSDSIFPGGDQLQRQLYENLNNYWLEGVP